MIVTQKGTLQRQLPETALKQSKVVKQIKTNN